MRVAVGEGDRGGTGARVGAEHVGERAAIGRHRKNLSGALRAPDSLHALRVASLQSLLASACREGPARIFPHVLPCHPVSARPVGVPAGQARPACPCSLRFLARLALPCVPARASVPCCAALALRPPCLTLPALPRASVPRRFEGVHVGLLPYARPPSVASTPHAPRAHPNDQYPCAGWIWTGNFSPSRDSPAEPPTWPSAPRRGAWPGQSRRNTGIVVPSRTSYQSVRTGRAGVRPHPVRRRRRCRPAGSRRCRRARRRPRSTGSASATGGITAWRMTVNA